jgi:acetyl-CoA C-acetyltransferase
MTEALLFDTLRTPRGRGRPGGSLHAIKPISLAVGLIRELLVRNPGLDPSRVDDVILGIVSPVGEQGSVLPRVAAQLAGLPDTVGGLQVNRFCGSGLEAVNLAAQKIRSGWEDVVVAGGVESMSRVPIGTDGGAWMHDPETAFATSFVPQGVSADLIATIERFDRRAVDAYAVRSHQRAAAAWRKGSFDSAIVPVHDRTGATVLSHDETVRPHTTLEAMAGLTPSFGSLGVDGAFDDVALERYHWLPQIEHVHHAGNSSGIVDGAALVLVGNERASREMGLVPRARIVATATSGADSTIMLTGPVPATRKLLQRTGLAAQDIDLFEVNEAFAAVPLLYAREFGIPDEKLNVNGGAIAMGHPLGATGAILVGTLLDELEARDLERGLITLCIGGGMGVATLIERI